MYCGHPLLLPPSGTHCTATLAGLSDGNCSIVYALPMFILLTDGRTQSPLALRCSGKELVDLDE